MKPRDYQLDCINATWNELTVDTEQRPATLALMPTGTGKTIVFGHLADRWIKEERGRVLILAHRRELIDQAAAKFHRVSGHRPHIEMADKHASKTSHFNWDFGQVVVGSVATMKGKRLGRWDKNAFSLIITDEAHHATASGYRSIYDHFDKAALVGVTATPDRSDKNPLGKVFGSVAYQMQILDAIQRGWLVPIRQKFVHVESIDLSGVASNWKGDDFDESKLDAVMRQDENIHRIARPTFETAGSRPTLVFATSVAHAKAISDVLNSYRQGCSAYVASYMLDNEGNQSNYPEETRTAEIAAFQAGQRQILVSCGVFLEGFDVPPVALVAMARPTKSRSLYAQALGRGTRPLDGVVDPWPTVEERIAAIAASAKPDCIAEGQMVLTDHGLVPIERVTAEMLVWDGIEFVTHMGVICKGEQEVITYAGLTATADHHVWTKEGWQAFGKCATEQIAICIAEHDGQAIREDDGYYRGNNQSQRQASFNGQMHWLPRGINQGLHKHHAGKSRMQEMRKSSFCSKMASDTMFGSGTAMQQSELRTISKLRRSRHQIHVRITYCNGSMDSGEHRPTQGLGNRSDRQQRQLRSRELALGKSLIKHLEYSEEKNQPISSCLQVIASRDSVFGPDSHQPHREKRTDSRTNNCQIQPQIIKTKRRVWDILNAGPRHRFTVSGLLVSNCLVMDFVGNSGKHKLVYADEVLFPDVDAATREKARKKAKDQDSADVRETMEQAEAEVEQEKQVKVAEIDKIRRRLSKQLLASFTMRDVDPFGNGEATPELNGYKVEVPVSEKQARFVMVLAKKLGKRYDFDAVMGMGRNKVRGMIASLQGQLKKREAVA